MVFVLNFVFSKLCVSYYKEEIFDFLSLSIEKASKLLNLYESLYRCLESRGRTSSNPENCVIPLGLTNKFYSDGVVNNQLL